MQKIQVAIVPQTDSDFSEIDTSKIQRLNIDSISIIENGTEEGNTVLGMMLTDGNGGNYYAEITGKNFKSLYTVFLLADNEFKNKQ